MVGINLYFAYRVLFKRKILKYMDMGVRYVCESLNSSESTGRGRCPWTLHHGRWWYEDGGKSKQFVHYKLLLLTLDNSSPSDIDSADAWISWRWTFLCVYFLCAIVETFLALPLGIGYLGSRGLHNHKRGAMFTLWGLATCRTTVLNTLV